MTPSLGRRIMGERRAPGPHRRADLAIGILLGLIIGLGAISAFVFLGSEGTLDAPRVPPAREAGRHHGGPAEPAGGRRAPAADASERP
ncbi:MAG TPA: hypothetical protein VFN89_06985 [Solirubrobacterales bacterium]|nr:hypothetical protein [Solirubrobacterales bacterium]